VFDALHKPMHDLHLPGLNRDDLLPRQPAGMGRGLMLALVAHVLLVIAIALNVHWNSSDPAGVEAELWSAVPQVAAQRSTPPEPEPEPATKPEPRPVPKPVEAPPPPKPLPDPQIAIDKEKARQEKLKEEKRREEEQVKRDKAEHQKREEAKKLEEKKLEEKKLSEKKKQEAAKAAQAEAQHQAHLERIRKLTGGNDNGSPGGKDTQTSGASSSYAGRIHAAVKPNIMFSSELNGHPTAEVEVRQGPDGTILGSRLVKSSGVKEWDAAVLRAVEKTQKLPRDIDGRVPDPSVIITFRWASER